MFFEANFQRLFPVTFLLVEAIAQSIVGGEQNEDVAISKAIVTVAKVPVTRSAIDYVVDRVREVYPGDTEQEASTPRTGRGFATAFQQWASSLSPEGVCLYLAKYDFEGARRLYCEVDKKDVVAMAALKIKEEWERSVLSYECSLYGFGGSYGNEERDDSDALDVNSEEGLRALSQFLGKKH